MATTDGSGGLSNCDKFAGGFNRAGDEGRPNAKELFGKNLCEISLVGFFSTRYTDGDLGPRCAGQGTCHREVGVAAPGRRNGLFGVPFCAGQRRNGIPSYALG
jgi:hypothetical protein